MDPKLFTPMHSRIYAIPYWVASTVRRKNMKLSDLLDFEKASQILSGSELASLHLFSKVANATVDIPALNKDPVFSSSFWHTDNDSKQTYDAENSMLQKYRLDDTFVPEMFTRLYSEVNNRTADVAVSRHDPKCGFEVVALRDQAIGVVMYNSIRDMRNSDELAYSVLRDIVKQLYVYQHASVVHHSYVYGMYLKTLHLRMPVAA